MSEQLMSPAAGTAKLQEPTVLPIEQPDRIDCGIDFDYGRPNLLRALAFAVPAGLVCWFVLIELARFAIHILHYTKAGR